MMSYEISVRCICGAENSYILNALRYPVVTLGRLQPDHIAVPDNNVCPDDGHRLSRTMLHFRYDKEKKDWLLSAGGPVSPSPASKAASGLPAEQQKKGQQLFYLRKEDFCSELNKRIPLLLQGEKLSCQNFLAHTFRPLGTQQIPLSSLVGVGLIDSTRLCYQGHPFGGVEHPLLGRLPFGWYIEIKAGRSVQTSVQSYVNKSTILAER